MNGWMRCLCRCCHDYFHRSWTPTHHPWGAMDDGLCYGLDFGRSTLYKWVFQPPKDHSADTMSAGEKRVLTLWGDNCSDVQSLEPGRSCP
ncbi:hypothetical protein lerEdw1_009771 [Lerista edwardsae]|nr:hypothetical protein lerEdw1_009771 [Lerista edwardsae]